MERKKKKRIIIELDHKLKVVIKLSFRLSDVQGCVSLSIIHAEHFFLWCVEINLKAERLCCDSRPGLVSFVYNIVYLV